MPVETAQEKRNRLPFKPPRRQSSGKDGSSSSSTPNKAATSKTTSTKRTSSSLATSSKSKTAQKSSSSSKSKATNSRKQKPITSDSEEESDNDSADEDDEDDTDSKSRSTSPFQEPDYILAEIVTNDRPRDIESDEPGIPPKLLTSLLHHHFRNPKTKIAKDANEAVAKYMDIFVREALARATYERAEGNAANGDGGGGAIADGFLEVEDLEKLAPQMILDF